MPNHVRNELYFECDNEQRIVELLNTICGENGKMDFNKIIPMPKELDIESSSRGDNGYEAYRDYINTGIKPQEIIDEFGRTRTVDADCLALGKKYFENIVKFGHKNWYGWRREHWGTKWNAYDDAELHNGVSFLTAWSAPFPVIETLSKMFPDVRITHYFADEDLGNNCGKFGYIGGKQEDLTDFEECSDEALKFACDIWGHDYDEYLEEIGM